MKIGFLGNTNNYPFIIACQMRELGCEVVFFVDAAPSDMLHRPEHYSSVVTYPYPDWIQEDLSLTNTLYIHFPQIFLRRIIGELNKCDAVILNGFGHRFKNFIKPSIPSISMFSGGDLEIMADYDNVLKMKLISPKLKIVPKIIKKWYAKFSVDQLRNGIRKASLISYFPDKLIPNGDKIIKEIFTRKGIERFNHFHVTIEEHGFIEPPDNTILRVFSFTRFMWHEPFPPGRSKYENKGNDIMIKGISLFVKKYNLPIDVHLVEKGLHVGETKELIADLDVSQFITWHKEMPFKELRNHIGKSDVVIEQLGSHYISGGLYAMLAGRPVIGNARPEIFDVYLNDKSPICHAVNPEEVCEWLYKIHTDKEFAHQCGKKSREYVLRHFDIKNETIYFKNFLQQLLKKQNA